MGPMEIYHLRRDFILALQYGLEDCGHAVTLSHLKLKTRCLNLVLCAYNLAPKLMREIAASGYEYAVINTEVIKDGMLNLNPAKTDLAGAYMPFMRGGRFTWDVIADNLPEYEAYGARAGLLRWGYHPALEDIRQPKEKSLDFYFFGSVVKRRGKILDGLIARGFNGAYDHVCPYFHRNNRIAAARVQLNLVQDERYTHVNSFRICYLANNRSAILSERESDPAGYLAFTKVAAAGEMADALSDLLRNDAWRQEAERSYEAFRKTSMKDYVADALEEGLARQAHSA